MKYRKPNILIVDNYDSFTFNLVQIIGDCGWCEFSVEKNDRVNTSGALAYDGFIFSPGPGVPSEAPVMAELLRLYGETKSFLGVCLGFQAIAEVYGMQLVRLGNVRHGVKERVRILQPPDLIFEGVPSEFCAGLYHSWGVCFEPHARYRDPELRVTALGNDDIVMAVAHTRFNIRGVQFHPESYMSENGPLIIQNWFRSVSGQGHPEMPGKE